MKKVFLLIMILVATIFVFVSCNFKHEHRYAEWSNTQNPTCTEPGIKTRYCDCGEKQIESVPAIGHNYEDEVCKNCGISIGETGCKHEHLDIIAATTPTCSEPGLTEGVFCNDCNTILKEQQSVPAMGHTYSTDWQNDETHHFHLAVCGCDDRIDVVTHTYDSDGKCIVCSYECKTRLQSPVIKSVEYDVVYWTPVANAVGYTVTVNDDYTYVTAGLSASLEMVSYNGNFIENAGRVTISVRANGSGNYISSDNSAVVEYFYVPEKKALSSDESKLYNYGIGYGYNLIENEPIDAEMISQNRIININKLLTLGEYYNPPITKGYFDSYRYSSVDELSTYFNGSVDINGGIKIAKIAKIKAHYGATVNESSRNYNYNEVYVVQDSIVYKTYGIKDYSYDDLEHCLTESFCKDILLAQSMKESQWLDYMYTKYGTHVILGVATGGTYTAQYVVSTNDQNVAQRVKQEFELSGGDIKLSSLVKLDLGIGVKMDSGYNWSNSETEAHFRISWTGSNGGGSSTPENIDAAIGNFESGLNESNAISVRFTTDGAISIGTLISMIDSSLGVKFEEYVLDKSDYEYKNLYSMYTKPSTLSVNIENVNGENVLYIDLSDYQNSGSISGAYNVNMLNGIFTVYSNMMGQRVDKIVVNGAFDKFNKTLIDGFSIKLAQGWNDNVTVVVNNLGVGVASENGLVDASALDPRYEVTVEYNGVNAVAIKDGTVYFHGSVNDDKYDFILSLDSGESLNYTTLQISDTIRLPVVIKANCSFTGWYDEKGNAITDGQGILKDGYSASNIPMKLYAKCDPIIYRIDFDHQGAEEFNGPDSIFIM